MDDDVEPEAIRLAAPVYDVLSEQEIREIEGISLDSDPILRQWTRPHNFLSFYYRGEFIDGRKQTARETASAG